MKHLPSLRHLRYLCALEEHLHFGRAADACAVTQSTLSTGLRELEASLGAHLVERTKRKVLFTPLGHAVAARARRVLRDAEDLVDSVRADDAPLSGELRLGIIPTIGPYLLPAVLPDLHRDHPDLALYLREDQTGPLLAQLDSGQLDLLVLALPYEIGGLETLLLGEDPLMLVCPADHPLAHEADIGLDQLSGTPLLLLEGGHCLREHALRACQLSDRGLHETFQGTSLRTLVPMVASGLGVSLLPAMAIETELGQSTGPSALVARPLRGAGATRQIALVWRPSSPRGAEFRLFGAALQRALRATEPAPVRG